MTKEIAGVLVSTIGLVCKRSRIKIHKARQDLMVRVIIGIITTRSIQLTTLCVVLNDEVENASNLRRIQDFIANYELSYVQMAILASCFLPEGKWTLAVDRTNWDYGKQSHNILAVTAYCKGVGVPLMYELLENRGGNSNEEQRIDLLGKILKVFGSEQIECVIGDREFIGKKWCKWLINKKMDFYIRIKDNALIGLPMGKEKNARHLVYWKRKRYINGASVFDCQVNVALKKTNKRNAKGIWENLIVITTLDPKGALDAYKKRWSIEVFFQSVKGRGFNLEKTHLSDPIRLKKLFSMVCIAFVACLKIGIWKHESKKKIRTMNHGYKAFSFFRYGLNRIQEAIQRVRTKPILLQEIIFVLSQCIELWAAKEKNLI